MCLEVLEYVWAPSNALDEFAGVLQPCETLILSTPFLRRVDTPDDYRRFTEPALRRLLAETGFEVEACLPQGHALTSSVNILRHVVAVQSRWVRRAPSILLRPLFGGLLWAETPQQQRYPELKSFSTGYLVVARRPAGRAS